MGSKEGKVSRAEYTEMYRSLMRESYAHHKDVWQDLLDRDEVTLVCFCKAGTFCHRYLLAEYFESLGANYLGERCGTKDS